LPLARLGGQRQENRVKLTLPDSLAATFTAIVNSFVSDILLPPLSILFPLNKNLDEKFAVLKPGPNYDELNGYNTLKLAQEDGAVVMAYGQVPPRLCLPQSPERPDIHPSRTFINKFVNFLGVGLALYGLAGTYQYFSHDPIIKHMVKCKYCRKRINEKVTAFPLRRSGLC
jgi:large conductance mechanosensitive channel